MHHPLNGASNRDGRLLLDEPADKGFGVGVRFVRGFAEELRHHLARHAGRAFAIDNRQHVAPVRARLR